MVTNWGNCCNQKNARKTPFKPLRGLFFELLQKLQFFSSLNIFFFSTPTGYLKFSYKNDCATFFRKQVIF